MISMLAIAGSLTVLAIGCLVMVTSVSGSQHFSLGSGLSLAGLVCTGLVLWFLVVNGKASIFRRRISPML